MVAAHIIRAKHMCLHVACLWRKLTRLRHRECIQSCMKLAVIFWSLPVYIFSLWGHVWSSVGYRTIILTSLGSIIICRIQIRIPPSPSSSTYFIYCCTYFIYRVLDRSGFPDWQLWDSTHSLVTSKGLREAKSTQLISEHSARSSVANTAIPSGNFLLSDQHSLGIAHHVEGLSPTPESICWPLMWSSTSVALWPDMERFPPNTFCWITQTLRINTTEGLLRVFLKLMYDESLRGKYYVQRCPNVFNLGKHLWRSIY